MITAQKAGLVFALAALVGLVGPRPAAAQMPGAPTSGSGFTVSLFTFNGSHTTSLQAPVTTGDLILLLDGASTDPSNWSDAVLFSDVTQSDGTEFGQADLIDILKQGVGSVTPGSNTVYMPVSRMSNVTTYTAGSATYNLHTNRAVVPEPSTLALLGATPFLLLGWGWRRRRKQDAQAGL